MGEQTFQDKGLKQLEDEFEKMLSTTKKNESFDGFLLAISLRGSSYWKDLINGYFGNDSKELREAMMKVLRKRRDLIRSHVGNKFQKLECDSFEGYVEANNEL